MNLYPEACFNGDPGVSYPLAPVPTKEGWASMFAKSIKPGVETFLQIASTPALLQDGPTPPLYLRSPTPKDRTEFFNFYVIAILRALFFTSGCHQNFVFVRHCSG